MTENTPRQLLTAVEYQDLCNALDILIGSYGAKSSLYQEALLAQYGKGSPDRERALKLFGRLALISTISTQQIQPLPSEVAQSLSS